MYNNIENIVYRMFQNYYDISVNVTSGISSRQHRDISSTENILPRNILPIDILSRDISSTYVSILMERIFDNSNNETYPNLFDLSYQDTLNDTSFIAYRFLPTYYAPTYYAPTNYAYNRTFYTQNYSFIDLLRTLSQNYTSEENSFLENFINSTFENNKEKFKKVISDYELEKLKPQIFIKKNETTTNCQCPIFCYNFEENEEIIKLPCNHNFNCEGIIKWLTQESNTCPVCRYEFDYKEINSDNKRQDNREYEGDYEGNYEGNYEGEYEGEYEGNYEGDYEGEYENENTEEHNINNIEEFDANFIQPNNISEDEIILQEILLHSYSTNNNNNTIT
jgi:hypothetical protein